MGCEYLGHKTMKDRRGVYHTRDFCTYTLEPCLIDDPFGFRNCTRRTSLQMQSAEPEPDCELTKHRGQKIADNQIRLV